LIRAILRRGAWLGVAALLAAAGPPTARDVQEAERARAALQKSQLAAQAQATAAQAEERRLANDRVVEAASLRALEVDLAKSADRVADLSQRRTDTQARLDSRAAAMGPLLPVIERLSRYPAETLLAVPQSPETAVRGLLVIGGLTRQLEAQAAELRAEQDDLAKLSAELDQAVADLVARQATQTQLAAVLDRQLDAARNKRHAAEGEAADWSRKAAAEAARADSLRQAIARIETERQAAEARQATVAARSRPEGRGRQEAVRPTGGPFSSLVVPVAGAVVRNFGDAVDGGTSSGMAYQVPPSARVVAPCGGRVVFSGPFRSFGLLTILDCGGGWHVVLSGFDRLDAQLGQNVQAGEPIGAMPGWNPLHLLRRPALNLELRRDGLPTNPAPYLHATG